MEDVTPAITAAPGIDNWSADDSDRHPDGKVMGERFIAKGKVNINNGFGPCMDQLNAVPTGIKEKYL